MASVIEGSNVIFQDDIYHWWAWMNSDGSIDQSRWLYCDHIMINHTNSVFSLTWIDSSNTNWGKIYEADSNGNKISDDLSSLIKYVEYGGNVKVMGNFNNDADATIVKCTETKAVNNQGVGCSFLSNMASVIDGNDVKFQDDIYHQFAWINSDGNVDQSEWWYGDHAMREHINSNFSLQWFADCSFFENNDCNSAASIY